MGIIIWVVIGVVLGFLANMLFDRNSTVVNIVMGVLGAALVGWVATLFGVGTWNAFSWINQLIAAAGACLVLFIGNKLLGSRAS